MAKKRTKKRAKKKTAKKKAKKAKKKKSKPALVSYAPLYNLHQKKLAIMREIPIMPCTAITKDPQGLRFAHTQAEKVYKIYREACLKRGLVTRRTGGELVNGKTVDWKPVGRDRWEIVEVSCVRFKGGVWEICDSETGEKETFRGDGDGNNLIWAGNSAQTIAKKQALLDYFEVAWPQPSNHCEVIRKSLQDASPEEFVKAMNMIIPEKIAKATGIIKMLDAFFSKPIKKKEK